MSNDSELALQEAHIAEVVARAGGELPWRRKRIQRLLKRALDVAVAVFLLLLLWPAILLTALLVRLTSQGPVLLAQTRLGLDGSPYKMLKFRSMVADRPDGSAQGMGEVTGSDPRLTPIGGWMRAWRLDELPQLFHVLSGRMSLVGPRPDIPRNLDVYTAEQLLRFAMPPGCTAWTFTRGAFGNDWHTRQNINVEYVRQWSVWLDVKILVGSLLVLVAQKNTTPERQVDPHFSEGGEGVTGEEGVRG
ncbi:MAG: sugar transferase [Chloroflexi bacterium]|nr:sugar transferase [Chloroflexota bacterium]MCI0725589.1 sugar transferase [Chloroflexota bacterium]